MLIAFIFGFHNLAFLFALLVLKLNKSGFYTKCHVLICLYSQAAWLCLAEIGSSSNKLDHSFVVKSWNEYCQGLKGMLLSSIIVCPDCSEGQPVRENTVYSLVLTTLCK